MKRRASVEWWEQWIFCKMRLDERSNDTSSKYNRADFSFFSVNKNVPEPNSQFARDKLREYCVYTFVSSGCLCFLSRVHSQLKYTQLMNTILTISMYNLSYTIFCSILKHFHNANDIKLVLVRFAHIECRATTEAFHIPSSQRLICLYLQEAQASDWYRSNQNKISNLRTFFSHSLLATLLFCNR